MSSDPQTQKEDKALYEHLAGVWAVTFGDPQRLARHLGDDMTDEEESLHRAFHKVLVGKGWTDVSDLPLVRELARKQWGDGAGSS